MLFGGLFSAYIFLRVASDTPWPTHVLDVKLGFTNTLILILSSITVLQAWLSLKVRKYGRYQAYMAVTILLSIVFMWIKLGEYNVKFHHYGVRLQDSSILEGHLKQGYAVQFGDVTSISIKANRKASGLADWSLPFINQGPDGKFLKYAKSEGDVKATDESGATVELTAEKILSDLSKKVAEAEKREAAKREEAAKVLKAWQADHPNEVAKPIVVPFEEVVVNYTTSAPVRFDIEPSSLLAYDQGTATFRDGTTLKGKLIDDRMVLTADKVDLRRLLPSNGDTDLKTAQDSVANADVWRLLGKEWKDKFLKHNQAMVEKYLGDSAGSVKSLNADFQRHAFTMDLEEAEAAEKPAGSEKAQKTSEATEAPQATAEGVKVGIPKSEIAFYSNFTPKYHNYYAIYFALTSLHGLHIIGGAVVLLYFLLFGRKMYETNPEHLANRVEVGGLFWHFVDVVWMFLFPVLYLF